MTDVKIEELPKNQLKLTFTVPHDDVVPFLDEAAARISDQTQIPGFRPGKAGYDVVKRRVGEMKIYEEALEPIVRKSFVEAILNHKIDTVGSPKIDVEKLAPGNDLVFTCEVARMPSVTRLADFRKKKVKAKKVETSDKEIDLALNDISRMQTNEIRAVAGEAAGKIDKVVVSMNMSKDGVPVEGGQSPNHAIYLTEEYYIPGLKEEVLGMKEGETKTFSLTFPKDHVQKLLAGANIDFEITLKELYHLEIPTIDDAFAKSLGQEDMATLKKLIRHNINEEKQAEEIGRQEKEMLEAIAKDSRFDDIPDLLLNEEINKMIQELQHGVEGQGANFDAYLKSIGRTLADLKIDFAEQALLRIKVALVIREIAKQEEIKPEEAQIDAELDRVAAQYDEEETRKQIYSPQYREYVGAMLRNRTVIDLLKDEMLESE